MNHSCDDDLCKYIEYNENYKEWYFMETEFGLYICRIEFCPFCGVELQPDGTTISP